MAWQCCPNVNRPVIRHCCFKCTLITQTTMGKLKLKQWRQHSHTHSLTEAVLKNLLCDVDSLSGDERPKRRRKCSLSKYPYTCGQNLNIHDCVCVYVLAVCSGEITDSVGVVLSPNWPEAYDKGQDCIWGIHVEEDKRIMLDIQVYVSTFHTRRFISPFSFWYAWHHITANLFIVLFESSQNPLHLLCVYVHRLQTAPKKQFEDHKALPHHDL